MSQKSGCDGKQASRARDSRQAERRQPSLLSTDITKCASTELALTSGNSWPGDLAAVAPPGSTWGRTGCSCDGQLGGLACLPNSPEPAKGGCQGAVDRCSRCRPQPPSPACPGLQRAHRFAVQGQVSRAGFLSARHGPVKGVPQLCASSGSCLELCTGDKGRRLGGWGLRTAAENAGGSANSEGVIWAEAGTARHYYYCVAYMQDFSPLETTLEQH